MPETYPPAAPTLSGDLLTISRLLQSPTAINRRLRTFRDLRFVSDQILTQRFRSTGGAVLYDQSEPFVNARTVEGVSPGSEYPFSDVDAGTAALAAIVKWGQKVRVTDEEIIRSVYAGQAIDRKLRKLVNSIIRQVDSVTLAAVASAVSSTSAASATWSTSSAILYDILAAKAVIVGQNLGYNPDTLLLTDAKYALLMSNSVITNAWRRETTENPVYTGQVETIAGLKIIVSPNLPTSDPWVLDSTQLGGMADEMGGAPGYNVADLGVETKTIRQDGIDAWDMQGRRKTVPVVQEPAAATRITST